MKLCYRGVPYTYEPPEVKTVATPISGIYRGVPYTVQRLFAKLDRQPVLNLVYRGVAYQTGQPIPEPAFEGIPTLTITVLTDPMAPLDDSSDLAETHLSAMER